MGRPRGFDEAAVVQSAAQLFAGRSYDGISIDDLVAHLGVHRNSLYQTFGSKRGLYLAALRWSLNHEVGPLVVALSQPLSGKASLLEVFAKLTTGPQLDLLLMAATERAPVDPEVADEVARALSRLDRLTNSHLIDSNLALPTESVAQESDSSGSGGAMAATALILGLRLRARIGSVDQPTSNEIVRLSSALVHLL